MRPVKAIFAASVLIALIATISITCLSDCSDSPTVREPAPAIRKQPAPVEPSEPVPGPAPVAPAPGKMPKLQEMEKEAEMHFQEYLKSGDKESRKKARLIFQDLYRRTPDVMPEDPAEDTEAYRFMARRHWHYFHRLLLILYYKKDYKYVESVLAEYIQTGKLDNPLIPEETRKALIDLHKLAGKKAAAENRK
jgi:hypothetical protein